MKKKHIILFFSILMFIYLLIFVVLGETTIYNIETGHNDRFFSADDVYYVKNFFSINMDASPRVIKHPLFIVFANIFTKFERLFFGEISVISHYKLIVILQIAVSLLSTWYLFLILSKQYKLPSSICFLVCSLYALAFSTLFYTFIAESYIFSSLVLLMTYYHSRQRHSAITIILGALAAGITITNAFLWAAIVFFSGGEFKKRFQILISGGILFCMLVAILPINSGFFTYILPGSLSSASNYSDNFNIQTTALYVFFAFFSSTIFYINTADMSPFGDFIGDALCFMPSASTPIVVLSICWLVVLVFTVYSCRKNSKLYAPLIVIVMNLLLHGVIQYGLKEAFLYSLHHFSAQLLIVSLLWTEDSPLSYKQKKICTYFYTMFLLCSVVLNIPGYLEISRFIAL